MKEYKRVLTIGGSDSGGGAGIQADLKTFSALGCYGMSVITAVTAQNTSKVTGVYPLPAEFVRKQLQAVFSDIRVDAVKIGMLFSKEIIEAVGEILELCQAENVVIDPVMIAKSGDKLLEDDAVQALKDILLPISDLVTPNFPEAEVLTGRRNEQLRKDRNIDHLHQLAGEILQLGTAAVLVKGGHLPGEAVQDFLLLKSGADCIYEGERILTVNTHGTGCTLSSAIAAFLARGFKIPEAVGRAKNYLTEAIKAGAAYKLGSGHGPVCHFWEYWNKKA